MEKNQHIAHAKEVVTGDYMCVITYAARGSHYFFYTSIRIFIIPCALSLVLNHINYYSVALIRRLIDVSARECIDTKQSISFLNLSAAHVWDVLFFFFFCIAHWWQVDLLIKPQ